MPASGLVMTAATRRPAKTLKGRPSRSNAKATVQLLPDLSLVSAVLRPLFEDWATTGTIHSVTRADDRILFQFGVCDGLFSVRDGEIRRLK